MLPSQNIAPQHTRQRRAKRQAESPVVHADRHAIYGTPEGTVRNVYTVQLVDALPGLDDAGEEDGRADVCTGELGVVSNGLWRNAFATG